MALGFGKKKQSGDDWSDESLKQELASLSQDDTAEAPPAEDDPLGDFMNDPAFADPAPVAPQADNYAPTTALVDDSAPAAKPKKKAPVVALAGGLVLLVIAGAAAAYFLLFSGGGENTEGDAPLPVPTRVAKKDAPTPPDAKKVPPAPKTATPAASPTPAKAPTPVITPIQPLPTPLPTAGAAGQPGRGSTRDTDVRIAQPTVPITPTLAARLKALWKQGADAKHKKTKEGYAEARKAWEEILKLRPGHPGVQEAIDKLPK